MELPLHLHAPFYRNLRAIHFSLNQQPCLLARTEIWARRKKVHLRLTSQIKHTCPGANPHWRARSGRWAAISSSGLVATTSGGPLARRKCGLLAAAVSGPAAEGGSQGGDRAGMAAAAAGAAQEKQFPPALLSFFIYNPRFGAREGEVRGAELCAGVTRRPRRGRGQGGEAGRPAGRRRAPGAAGCVPLAALARPAPVTLPSLSVTVPRLLRARCAPSPGDTGTRKLHLFRSPISVCVA